jgi:hypothetical protein
VNELDKKDLIKPACCGVMMHASCFAKCAECPICRPVATARHQRALELAAAAAGGAAAAQATAEAATSDDSELDIPDVSSDNHMHHIERQDHRAVQDYLRLIRIGEAPDMEGNHNLFGHDVDVHAELRRLADANFQVGITDFQNAVLQHLRNWDTAQQGPLREPPAEIRMPWRQMQAAAEGGGAATAEETGVVSILSLEDAIQRWGHLQFNDEHGDYQDGDGAVRWAGIPYEVDADTDEHL